MKNEKLTKAKYIEFQAALFGACFIAFGLGIILISFFEKYALLIILLLAVLYIHN